MVNKNLTGFFLVNHKIFLTQAQANAQAKLDGLTEHYVTYHPPFSQNYERCKEWKGVEKIEWGNPATYRPTKPKSLSKILSERGKQLEEQDEYDYPVLRYNSPILSPLQAVMVMEREYYEN